MDYPKNKKQRITDAADTLAEAVATSGDLSTDLLANILGCLHVEDMMRSRGVNKKWKEAVKMTIVPLHADFVVNGLRKYNTMNVMTTELPNLQQITIGGLGWGDKWSDGEDPYNMEAARTSDWTTHDIEIISNFSKLRYLKIEDSAILNGRYPFLFNFPLLQTLHIHNCNYLKWDLGMLGGFPLLKELDCWDNMYLAGNISSLRVLKETLESVRIINSGDVEGNFMDLADFPRLKGLDLGGVTAVTGDIRDIGENDFSSLEQLDLPRGVYGGIGMSHEFQSISDAPEFIRAVYLIRKQHPSLEFVWRGHLSRDSPDWYESMSYKYPPPFYIRLVEAGSRIGYRWIGCHWRAQDRPCEVNWLDPEPDRENSDYEEYIAKLQEMHDEVKLYRGFHQPPTEEEYYGLLDEYDSERTLSPTVYDDSTLSPNESDESDSDE